jgi:hypothetical protein
VFTSCGEKIPSIVLDASPACPVVFVPAPDGDSKDALLVDKRQVKPLGKHPAPIRRLVLVDRGPFCARDRVQHARCPLPIPVVHEDREAALAPVIVSQTEPVELLYPPLDGPAKRTPAALILIGARGNLDAQSAGRTSSRRSDKPPPLPLSTQ